MKDNSDIVTEITIDKWQIKSLKKARKIAKALAIIEREAGIRTVRINFTNSFLCSDIDITKLNKTPMERCLVRLFIWLEII